MPSQTPAQLAVLIVTPPAVPNDFVDLVKAAVGGLPVAAEMVVCAAGDPDDSQHEPHAAHTLRGVAAGLAATTAPIVIVIDAAVRPGPQRIEQLWRDRDVADIVVASRFSRDRATKSPNLADRRDRWTDQAISRLLSLDALDVRSGTRLYRRRVLEDAVDAGVDLDEPVALLAAAASRGWRIWEQPLDHWPVSVRGQRTGRVAQRPRLGQLRDSWATRNSIEASDYDLRAFNSRLPPQRWWQQHRHAVTMRFVDHDRPGPFLNVGCGSGWMSLDLPGSIGVDIVHTKLRHMRRYGSNAFVNASIFELPFAARTFGTVICTEVIEHVPDVPSPIDELVRVVRADGRLVLTTPDYGRGSAWPVIERIYGAAKPLGYADEHITHYTRTRLIDELARRGWRCVGQSWAFRSILVAAFEQR